MVSEWSVGEATTTTKPRNFHGSLYLYLHTRPTATRPHVTSTTRWTGVVVVFGAGAGAGGRALLLMLRKMKWFVLEFPSTGDYSVELAELSRIATVPSSRAGKCQPVSQSVTHRKHGTAATSSLEEVEGESDELMPKCARVRLGGIKWSSRWVNYKFSVIAEMRRIGSENPHWMTSRLGLGWIGELGLGGAEGITDWQLGIIIFPLIEEHRVK